MTTVFIAGSISINRLHEKVQERIKKIISSDFSIVVGDADGADTSIQECLHSYLAKKVTVFCTEKPRNNVAAWPTHVVYSKAKAGTRAYFTAKDLEMARNSDYGLMIWDCKSPGTLSNVIELLIGNKKSVVFVNKTKNFVTVSDKSGLDHLLTLMTDDARAKAEEKIDLSTKIARLMQEQFPLDIMINVTGNKPPSSPSEDDLSLSDFTRAPPNTESMRLRSTLISALKEHISRTHLSRSQAAKVFGVTQLRISDLTRGKADLFGLDALVNMAAMAGLCVEMHVLERPRTTRSSNLT